MSLQKTHENLLAWQSPEALRQALLIRNAYLKWTGQQLFPGLTSAEEVVWAIYHAPFAIVSHGTEADPIFNYANAKAQELWQYSWEEFTSLPSRKSAEPVEESKRMALLDEARKQGIVFIKNGLRISSAGKRFNITDVALFSVLDEAGNFVGQCAVIPEWEFL